MKKFTLLYLSVSLLSVVTLAILFGSCREENPVRPERSEQSLTPASQSETGQVSTTGQFKKEITLTDLSGKNKVTLEVSSDDKAVLARYNKNTFQLRPLFEQSPENDEQESQENTARPSDSPEPINAFIKIKEQKIEHNALGFSIAVNAPQAAGGACYAIKGKTKSHYKSEVKGLGVNMNGSCATVHFVSLTLPGTHKYLSNLCKSDSFYTTHKGGKTVSISPKNKEEWVYYILYYYY